MVLPRLARTRGKARIPFGSTPCLVRFSLMASLCYVVVVAYLLLRDVPPSTSTSNLKFSRGETSTHQWIHSCRNDNGGRERWSERKREKSEIRSMFNCDAPNARCKYYYPSNFFDEKCGLGRDYAYQIRDMKAMMKNNTLWPNMPAVGYPTITLANFCFNNTLGPIKTDSSLEDSTLEDIGEHIYENDRCLTERLSALHVHKAGGTSIRSAIIRLGKMSPLASQLVRHKWFRPPRRAISELEDSQLESLSSVTVGTDVEVDWQSKGRNGRKYNGTVLHREEGASAETSHRFVIKFEHGPVETLDLAAESFRVIEPSKNATIRLPPVMDESTDDDPLKEAKNRTMASLRRATAYPTERFGPQEHVLFAAVRDPAERFISSIGQAMGARGSQRNLVCTILQRECLKSTSRETLSCMARYVRDHGHWIELHFAPQVVDVSFSTMFRDVPVAVFPFGEVGRLIDYLGSGDEEIKHRGRPHEVLKNMTVAHYDEGSLRTVCEIYRMDVIMQRSMGLEVPGCDPFV